MKFTPTALPGAWIVEPECHEDERGAFARTWCAREFEAHGLNPRLVQCNISWNRVRGILRGMHYQREPHGEAKLVRCTHGAIYDVLIDLRPESPAYCRWFGLELSRANRTMLYIPTGMAHGFQTLTDDSEVFYQMSEFHAPESAAGVRWDDPAFGVSWPHCECRRLSARDASWPDFVPQRGS